MAHWNRWFTVLDSMVDLSMAIAVNVITKITVDGIIWMKKMNHPVPTIGAMKGERGIPWKNHCWWWKKWWKSGKTMMVVYHCWWLSLVIIHSTSIPMGYGFWSMCQLVWVHLVWHWSSQMLLEMTQKGCSDSNDGTVIPWYILVIEWWFDWDLMLIYWFIPCIIWLVIWLALI